MVDNEKVPFQTKQRRSIRVDNTPRAYTMAAIVVNTSLIDGVCDAVARDRTRPAREHGVPTLHHDANSFIRRLDASLPRARRCPAREQS